MPNGIKIGALNTGQWQTLLPPDVKAVGDISVSLTVSGTAAITTKRAQGSITIDLSILGAATGNNGSVGAVDFDMSIAGAAHLTDVNRAQGDITKNITLAGTSNVLVSLNAELTIPMVVDAFMQAATTANVTLPALTADASVVNGNTASTRGPIRIPPLTVVALGGNDAYVVLPSLQLDAQAISENHMVGRMNLPLLSMTGAFSDDRAGSADVSIHTLHANGTLVSGAVADMAMELPALRAYGEIGVGQLITGGMTLPALEMTGVVLSENLGSADLTLPALIMLGYAEEPIIVEFSGWSTNVEVLATSEYINYPYLLVANVFGRYIGVSANGVFDLAGPDDNNTDIDADVVFGFDSFRTEDLKRVKAVHLGYRADNDGDLEIQIVVDGEDRIRTYPVKHVSSTSGMKRGRATIAKGLKSRYWQYGFLNVDGADFIVDDLNVYVQQHNRKAQ